MALVPADRTLLQRCLNHDRGAWNDFVDRFSGLIYHVVQHTAHLRSVILRPEDLEDVAAEVLLQIVNDDYAVLRRFEGRSSLATYLTVIARRICVHDLVKRATALRVQTVGDGRKLAEPEAPATPEPGLDSLEEVQNLLRRLPRKARQVVRLFYLEGRSYEEISKRLHMPVNTIGPILSRAKQSLRKRLLAKGMGKK